MCGSLLVFSNTSSSLVFTLQTPVTKPLRYPVTPFSAEMDKMLLLHVGQLVPSNLSVSSNIGGMLVPDEVMSVVIFLCVYVVWA